MTVISVENLCLSFGPRLLFRGVSFALEATDRLGIVGPNGCGKSTLLKLMLGKMQADEGKVYIAKDTSVGILTQEDAFEISDTGGNTALEQMYGAFPELIAAERRISELGSWLERHPDEADTEKHASITKEYSSLQESFNSGGGHVFRSKCRSVLERMGFDEETMSKPVTELSGGQRTRLALSRQLCREPDILILDEPTNHLDTDTLVWLESFLSAYPKCIIVVSHDRYFLDRVTNKTLMIEHAAAKLYKGGWTQSAAQRAEDRAIYEKHYREQQKEIARQEAYIAQQRQWNRERNIIAAESRLKLLDKMEKLEAPVADEKTVRMKFRGGIQSGNDVFNVRNLSFAYPGCSKTLDSVSFAVKRGERVFICGPNGCGKSTLIKLLLEKLHPTCGAVDAGHNVEIGYYDQENQNLHDGKTVLAELWDAYPAMKESEVRGALAAFLFRNDDVFREVSVLSGGERARLTLVRLMLSKMNTLLLDEPTNHLDIGSREALESAVSAFEGTVICVSHDRAFINSQATRILGFDGEGHLYSLPVGRGSGWDEWQEKRSTLTPGEAPVTVKEQSVGKEDYLRRKKEASEARKNASRIERLRKEQAELEEKIDALNAELFGDAANDYVRAAEITAEIEKCEERLLAVYEELEQ